MAECRIHSNIFRQDRCLACSARCIHFERLCNMKIQVCLVVEGKFHSVRIRCSKYSLLSCNILGKEY